MKAGHIHPPASLPPRCALFGTVAHLLLSCHHRNASLQPWGKLEEGAYDERQSEYPLMNQRVGSPPKCYR